MCSGSEGTLPRPPIAPQRLFLSDVAHPLGLLVPHLNHGDPVARRDTDGDLLAPGLDLL